MMLHVYSVEWTKYDWCYWDDEKKQVVFSHNLDYKIPFSSKPSIKMSSVNWLMCLIDQSSNDIFNFDLLENKHECIQLAVHKVENIDCVLNLRIDLFVMRSLQDRSLTVLRKKENGWTVSKIEHWEDDTRVMSNLVLGSGMKFLPAAYLKDAKQRKKEKKKHLKDQKMNVFLVRI